MAGKPIWTETRTPATHAAQPAVSEQRDGFVRFSSVRSGGSCGETDDDDSIPSTGDDESDHFTEAPERLAVSCLRWGAATSQGSRLGMEDAHIAVPDISRLYAREFETKKLLSFFGVFDGHGGAGTALFAQKHLLDMLVEQPSFPGRPGEALTEAFLRTDEMLYSLYLKKEQEESGSTALAALVAGGDVIVANAGDSRAVLCRRGKAIELSRDHRPSSINEQARVNAAGGRIVEGYLNNHLSVTRALGDFHIDGLKAMQTSGRLVGPLTANPEVITHHLLPEDEFMVVACDGLWDVSNSARIIELARCQLQDHNDPDACAAFLVQHCLGKNVTDNLTAIVVCFSDKRPPPRASYKKHGGVPRTLSRNGLSTLSCALAEAAGNGGLQRCHSSNGALRSSAPVSPMVSRRNSGSTSPPRFTPAMDALPR